MVDFRIDLYRGVTGDYLRSALDVHILLFEPTFWRFPASLWRVSNPPGPMLLLRLFLITEVDFAVKPINPAVSTVRFSLSPSASAVGM